jgi:adenylosuccinate lyase
MSRQDAYKVVQTNAMQAWQSAESFKELLTADSQVSSLLTAGEVAEVFDYGSFLKEIDGIFARAGLGGAAEDISSGGQPLAPRSY